MEINAKPLSYKAAEAARAKWNSVAKPLKSLGQFEDMIVRIAAIQGTVDISLAPRCALVFCADHGVVARGVSQSGSEVTSSVARSIARGESNINIMASMADTDVFAVDMGMKTPVADDNIINFSKGRGTADFSIMPAMSRETAESALADGISLVKRLTERGYRLFVTGEMGIGNTTASAALCCALTDLSPEEVTCRGSGLSDAGLERKKRVIEEALKLHSPKPDDPIGALAALGGFEIAGMAGAFLGAVQCGAPIVIDGVISAVSALVAARICPEAVNYMLPSHLSRSVAAAHVLNELGLRPVIDADMALGEGTGAVMLLPLIDMAKRVYDSAHTFSSLDMEPYIPL